MMMRWRLDISGLLALGIGGTWSIVGDPREHVPGRNCCLPTFLNLTNLDLDFFYLWFLGLCIVAGYCIFLALPCLLLKDRLSTYLVEPQRYHIIPAADLQKQDKHGFPIHARCAVAAVRASERYGHFCLQPAIPMTHRQGPVRRMPWSVCATRQASEDFTGTASLVSPVRWSMHGLILWSIHARHTTGPF
jgi:hypothetical protein